MKKLILVLASVIIMIFIACHKDIEFDRHQNVDVYESLSVEFKPVINANESGGRIAGASVAELDSVEVMMYYDKAGVWTEAAKANFSDNSDLSNFKNPIKVAFEPPIKMGHVLKARCRFVIKGFDENDENSYYGIVEADLKGSFGEELITVPMVETKTYFGIDISELTLSDNRYVFDYSYGLEAIDYVASATTLPPIDGNFTPVYYYETAAPMSGQLVVEGESVTLNGVSVSADEYIDVAEHFGAAATTGVNWDISVYDNADVEVFSNSINKNWLEFGINHYVQIISRTDVEFGFTLIDNEDVTESWDLSESESMPSIFEGMLGYWDLQNDVIDGLSQTDADTQEGSMLFNGEWAYFNGSAGIGFVGSEIRDIGSGDFSLAFWFIPEVYNHGTLISKRQWTTSDDITYYTSNIECFMSNGKVTLRLEENTIGSSTVFYGPDFTSASAIESDGSPHFLSLVRKGDLWELRIDGNLEISVTMSGDMSGNVASWPVEKPSIMLGTSPKYVYRYTGYMRYVSFHDRALIQEELQYFYNEGQGRSYSEL